MRKTFAAAGVAAAIAGGSVAGLAFANGESADSAAPEQDAVLVQNGPDEQDARDHGPRGGALDAAAEIIGVEQESLRDALSGGQTLAEVAEANGVSQEELVAQLAERANERIDRAVQDGRLTQQEADEKRASLDERIAERVTSDVAAERGERRGPAIETAARVIGEFETSIVADLRGGQSLAEIATSAGVEPGAVVDAIVDDKTERIQQRVENGTLTQERADEKLASLDERVEARVNGERPDRPGLTG